MSIVARGTCRKCGAMWQQWSSGGWSPLDERQRPGSCCFGAADFPASLMLWIGWTPKEADQTAAPPPQNPDIDPVYFYD